MSDYFPYQLSGPIANAFKEAVSDSFSDALFVTSYLYAISIEHSEEQHLENIGMLVGFLRPLVPSEFAIANPFTFTNETLTPFAPGTGFADAFNPTLDAGLFSSAVLSPNNKLSLIWYRKLLMETAKIKYQGISIEVIDNICHTLNDTYTITLEDNGDISVVFPATFSRQYTYILKRIFSKICTSPQVFISKEV